ncbi:MAG: acyltransferase [Ignavibacteriota bacterium]
MGPLWSISVEEQFYAIWPPIVKFGGKKLAYCAAGIFMIGAGVWIWVFSAKGWRLWYDTPVEFLFFAAGVLIALRTHRKELSRTPVAVRCALMACGIACLAAAVQFGGVGTDNVPSIDALKSYIGYGGAMAGCTLIFISVLGISRIPSPIIYLGKISFGLYVFHGAVMGTLQNLTNNAKGHLPPMLCALMLCIVGAHLSYQLLEKPFLRMKERFEVVHSRPA